MSVDDDDSLMINVEPPLVEKAKNTSHLSSWEYQVRSWEPLELKIFMVVSDVYVRKLIDKSELPRLTESQRKRLGPACLILQEIEYEWITENGVERDRDPYRGEIIINYIQYHGLQVILKLGELDISSDDIVQLRFLFYSGSEEINYKTYILTPMANDNTALSTTVDQKLFETYCKPRLAMEFTVRKQPVRESKFRGIQNQGNTCYMNSTLQILFFLRPLRKTILDFEGKSPLMEAIKRVFVELLDVNSDSSFLRPVDASELLSAYGRFPDPRKQQDIHQFLLGFLDELEGECPQLKQLWLGHGHQVLTSQEPDKPYTSTLSEDFNELDLLLEDHRGNTLGQLSQALHKLLDQEHVDDKIETDDYGKVDVVKRRDFSELPKVIFFNLKRYKYRKDRNRLVKILTDFEYPPTIHLGFLQGTPTGQDEDYVLFGVAVHRGQAYNSGHYFSFVNTSQDPDKPYWIKFNDSFVNLASEETALSFTGGRKKTLSWSREPEHQRFIEKEIISEETAYLLVYIRRDKFRQYQSISTPIPREWLLKRRQAEMRPGGKSIDVELLVLEEDTGDLFEDISSLPLALNQDEEVHQQLARLGHQFLGCKVGSIWKVNRQRRKIKQIVNYIDLPQTPARIFDYKRGHTIPDYLLVVPDSYQIYRAMALENRRERLGIVSIVVKEGDNVKRSNRIISKESLQEFISEEGRRLGKKEQFDDKDRFVYDWTDHCTINFD